MLKQGKIVVNSNYQQEKISEMAILAGKLALILNKKFWN